MTKSVKKKVALIGTNGLPSNYGGFETLVDNLTNDLSDEFDFIVYCPKTPKEKRHKSLNNSRLKYFPFKANGWQSIIYDTITSINALFTAQVLVVLGPAAGFMLPLNWIFRRKLIVNHGGLNEWEREKYSAIAKLWVRINHHFAALAATHNISDNSLLQESIKNSFGADSEVISYGGDHSKKVKPNAVLLEKYPFLNTSYAVSVSRAQVDNNLHLVLEAFEDFSEFKLVLVSNWNVSDYGKDLYEQYKDHANMILLNAVYDRQEIDAIRSNALFYIHSHSRCGTSPSLVEAMCLGLPILSYNVPTNRETTQEKAWFFKDSMELQALMKVDADSDFSILKEDMTNIGITAYSWKVISNQYKEVFEA